MAQAQATTNINGSMISVIGAANDNYSEISQIVLMLMQISALQTQAQSALTDQFNRVENENPTEFASDPDKGGFTNCIYNIKNPDKSDPNWMQKYSALFAADNADDQAKMNQFGAGISQLNTSVNNDTTGESTILSICSAINNCIAGLTRYLG